jgi:hypothetical protein
VASKTCALGHLTSSSYGGSSTTTVIQKTYAVTPLRRPAHGSVRDNVACLQCGNIYRIRVDSVTMQRLHKVVLRVLFPVIVLLTMIIPGMAGAPDSWLLYFLPAIASWIAYKVYFSSRGAGRPKLVRSLGGEKGRHETIIVTA